MHSLQRFTVTAALTPSSLAFANQTVGTQSGGLTAYLTNSGALPITVSKVAIAGTNPGDFQVYYNNCTAVILSQTQNCYVQVTFTPNAKGARSATLQVTDNGVGGTQTAALSGTGQ